MLDVLQSMPGLAVLYLQGNPVVKKIPFYRKTVVGRLKALTYLDDKPVFEDERLRCNVWYAALTAPGGTVALANEAERHEIERLKKEKKEKEEANFQAFSEFVRAAAESAKKAREEGQAQGSAAAAAAAAGGSSSGASSTGSLASSSLQGKQHIFELEDDQELDKAAEETVPDLEEGAGNGEEELQAVAPTATATAGAHSHSGDARHAGAEAESVEHEQQRGSGNARLPAAALPGVPVSVNPYSKEPLLNLPESAEAAAYREERWQRLVELSDTYRGKEGEKAVLTEVPLTGGGAAAAPAVTDAVQGEGSAAAVEGSDSEGAGALSLQEKLQRAKLLVEQQQQEKEGSSGAEKLEDGFTALLERTAAAAAGAAETSAETDVDALD